MIRVIYETKDNKFQSMTVRGHANSAEFGKDLVCSAVSGIVLGGLNALDSDSFDIKIDDGNVEINAKSDVNEHDSIVLETILTQISAVQESNSKFIQITRKDK